MGNINIFATPPALLPTDASPQTEIPDIGATMTLESIGITIRFDLYPGNISVALLPDGRGITASATSDFPFTLQTIGYNLIATGNVGSDIYLFGFSRDFESVIVISITQIFFRLCISPFQRLDPSASPNTALVTRGCSFVGEVSAVSESEYLYIFRDLSGNALAPSIIATLNRGMGIISVSNNVLIANNLFTDTLRNASYIYVSAFDADLRQIGVLQISIYPGTSTSLPSPPGPNHNFCREPIITISNLSNNNFCVNSVEIEVLDAVCHKSIDSRICTCTECITNGTRFTLSNIDLGRVIKTSQVGNNNDSLILSLIGYSLLKLILARLVFNNLSLKWLLRRNYDKLIEGITKSRYNNFLPVLEQFSFLETYFKC